METNEDHEGLPSKRPARGGSSYRPTKVSELYRSWELGKTKEAGGGAANL